LKLGTPQVVSPGKPVPAATAAAPSKAVNHRASAAPATHASAPVHASEPQGPIVPGSEPAIADPAVPVTPIVARLSIPEAVPEIVATRESLSAVAVGTPRQEVLAKLGTPSSRISMFDEGEAVEILRFQSKTASLGSVRIINGAVAEVTLVDN